LFYSPILLSVPCLILPSQSCCVENHILCQTMMSRSTTPLQEHSSLSGGAIIAEDSLIEDRPTVPTEHPGLETPLSTDQFDNRRNSSDGAATPILASRDLEEQYYESRKAPTRAIYEDLSTAVSSIRSGSARGRYRSDSQQPSIGHEGEGDIPMQNLQPLQRQEDDPAFKNMPIQSLGSRLSQSMSLELNTVIFPARNSLTQQKHREPNWNPIKRTWAALSSFTRGDVTINPRASQLPRDDSDPLEPVKQSDSRPISGYLQNEENNSSVPHSQCDSNSGNWSKYRKRGVQSSLQEGSTIDNIVRQYKGSDAGSNGGVDISLRSRPTPSFNPNLSHVSDSSFFSDSYVEDPARLPHGSQRRAQHLLEEPASHPKQYDPPQLCNSGFPRSEGRNDLASANSYSDELEFTSSELGQTNRNSSTFRMRRNRSSTTLVLNEPRNAPHNSPARPPLEQVIQELRHRSDFTTMSTNSNSTVQQYSKSPRRTYHTQQAQAQLERHVSEISIDEETRRLAVPVLFYDRKAIDPDWSTNSNGLRVPINKHVSRGASKRQGHGPSRETDIYAEDDPEDWETIMTEPAIHQTAYHSGYVGGTSGSSIGEMSDDGVFRAQQEANAFSSAERIIQHPGKIHYHGDYRQITLKETKIPVMIPQYGAHRVNGYAADSIRTRPPHPYYSTPSPLGNSHKNPFSSHPPEVILPRSRKPTGIPKLNQGRSLFPVSSKGTSVATDDSEAFPRAQIPQPELARTNMLRQLSHAPSDTECTFSTQSSVFVGNERKHPRISWDYITTFVKPSLNHGFNHAGSRNTPRSPMPSSSEYQVSPMQADGFTEVSLYAGRNSDAEGRSTTAASRTQSGKDSRDDFAYRPPLAPPRRKSWRALYTKSQLGRLELAGEVAGMRRGARQSHFERATERCSPFEGLRQHNAQETRADAAHEVARMRCEKISTAFLGLCNIFPPLLILFATGNLDAIMFWWSKGEFNRFRSRQKRWAWYLVCAWFTLLIIALVAVFVVRIRKMAA
jgi:hypothetical protein